MPVSTPSKEYSVYCSVWRRCRDCFAGEDNIKAASSVYLPPLEGQKEDSPAYKAYLRRAMFYPAAQRTVYGLVGMVLRKPIVTQCPPDVEKHLQNLTLTGEGLVEVALRVLQEDLVVGRVGILLDWSDGAERPFWRLYCAEDIVGYQCDVFDGVPVVVRVVLKEEIETYDPADEYAAVYSCQYRELFLSYVGDVAGQPPYFAASSRVHTQSATDKGVYLAGEVVPLRRRGRPLPFLPFTFLGPIGVQPAIEKPPLLDLVNLNLSHYRTSADLEHGRHFTALPTPWITGWSTSDPMAIGSGEAWVIPTPDAKVGMLEFTGQGLGALEHAIEQKERGMAILGARLLEGTPARQETAEAVRLRHSGEHAVLATIAGAASQALTNALQQHAWWMGHENVRGEAGEQARVIVELNKDFFDARLTAQEGESLMKLWQGGAISYETLYWNLQQGEWARPEVTWEAERDQISAEEPMESADAMPPADPDQPVPAPEAPE